MEIPRKTTDHSKLDDMPDIAGVNRSHDSRYYTKAQSIQSFTVNKITYSATPPENPQVGDLWIDSSGL